MAEIECARQLRAQETWKEKLVWRWLRGRRFNGYKFRRQHPVGIYYLDFFCEEAMLPEATARSPSAPSGSVWTCPQDQDHSLSSSQRDVSVIKEPPTKTSSHRSS
jgi:hypothetical protein